MSYFRTGDPLDDFHRRDMLQAKWEASLPECDKCGYSIQDEHYYEVEGKIICPHCMETYYKRENEACAE